MAANCLNVYESSSESDSEERVRNVSRLVIRPPGHTGKAKKGHLVFDAAFQSGNLGRVDRINEFEYDLFVRPDISNPRYRFWFNFTIENSYANQNIILNIVNIGKVCTLFHEGFAPVVRSSSRREWCRIPSESVFYYRSPYHRMRYVYSFCFVLDREDDVYQFALCYPYTYSKLCNQLEVWQQNYANKVSNGLMQTQLRFEVITIGKTLQNRNIQMLIIGSNHNNELSKHQQHSNWSGSAHTVTTATQLREKAVIITVRSHPSETVSSYVCQGIIELLLSEHPAANCLLRYVTFYIFVMVNPDAVFVGNTRTSILGADLNRNWQKPSSLMQPELVAIKEALNRIKESFGSVGDVDVYLDLHAHSNILGSCIYGTRFDDIFRMERHALFPKLLSQIASDFYIDNTVYCKEPLRSGSARRCMASIFSDNANCYTMEVSFYGYYDKATLGHTIIPYTERGYMRLGENVVLALLDCYRTIGHIPSLEVPLETIQLLSHTTQSHTDHFSSVFKLLDPITKLTLKTNTERSNK